MGDHQIAGILVGKNGQPALGSVIFLLLAGCIFLKYGLTREPLYFNELNPWKKPLPVWAARVTYLPMAGLCFFFALRELFR